MVSFRSSTSPHLCHYQAEPAFNYGGHCLASQCATESRVEATAYICSAAAVGLDAERMPAIQQKPGCKGCVWSAGSPLELVQPDTLRWKVMEPVLLLGKHRFEAVDIRIRVKGGGNVSQIYGAPPQHIHCLPQPMA